MGHPWPLGDLCPPTTTGGGCLLLLLVLRDGRSKVPQGETEPKNVVSERDATQGSATGEKGQRAEKGLDHFVDVRVLLEGHEVPSDDVETEVSSQPTDEHRYEDGDVAELRCVPAQDHAGADGEQVQELVSLGHGGSSSGPRRVGFP